MIRALITFISMYFASAYKLPSKFIQESEIKHGRVAMLSSVAIPLLDNVKPDTLGVNFVNSLDPSIQWTLLGIVGCSEFAQMLKAYNFPDETKNWFTFKDEHSPGDYGFDPLNIINKSNEETFKVNELAIGRTAMIASVCEMSNELFTKNSVF